MKSSEVSPRICIMIDRVRTASPDYCGCLSGWQWESLRSKILRAGLPLDEVEVKLFNPDEGMPDNTLYLLLGEEPLKAITGKTGIDKWHLSPFQLPGNRTVIASFDMDRSRKQYEVGLYQEMSLRRLAEFRVTPFRPPTERFLLNPSLEETFHVLDMIKTKEEVAVDVETGYGQINTVGFAWSESDAIAINVLPDRCSTENYFILWQKIADVLQGPSRKILQNFIYDTSYFSAYGIRVEGEIFDTMWAMKILWPEFRSNLGNVGRFYTRRPYWKDDGKVTDEEGQKKDWGNVRDWVKHYTYNCRDTTGTFEASRAQRKDLESRGIYGFFSSYIQRLSDPIREMCGTGVPLDLDRRERIKEETERRISELKSQFIAEAGDVNPRSPKQVQGYLRQSGIILPKKYDKEKGVYRESADSAAIKKIRLKRPDLKALEYLQEIKTLDKALSSYIDFEIRPDGVLPYSLNGCGTETLRMSGGKDPWDRGFNIQTIPRGGGDGPEIKSMFLAPEGHSFLECDLRQAESRFVAYDSADKTLIDMLESGADVHTHVGNAILKQMGKDPSRIPKDEFKQTWRQLGKKAGHGLNYGMKASVFVETVFNELDIVITKKDAEQITQAYYGLFPGIPRWHDWIRRELYQKRRLSAPSGWERYFYGRPGDDMLKEGLAFRPQHTIPWITNKMMLYLTEERRAGNLDFRLIAQVHDSLILLVPDANLKNVASACLDYKKWHPTVDLAGGRMFIPTEVKAARRLSEAQEIRGC